MRNATVDPDITTPRTRPRRSAGYKSATTEKPTTQVVASAAPSMSLAAKSHDIDGANANSTDEAASAIMPPTRGRRRPVRSDSVPIGIDVSNTVRPNDANSSPMSVGDAPNRLLMSGSTGTAIA